MTVFCNETKLIIADFSVLDKVISCFVSIYNSIILCYHGDIKHQFSASHMNLHIILSALSKEDIPMTSTDATGLLFYLSGQSFTADFAHGRAETTFRDKVSIIDDPVQGKAIQCEDPQKLAWKAPHNIYAERGTLSFFWRSRYPVGPTEFPVFRVSFADHSSWDACWLRIDYNGSGFEAMITDINLSRARVAAKVEPFPASDQWIHLTLAWDENWGIKFYVNGELAAEEYRPAVYFTGLDQFGPHSRIISNWNVISDYNFIRGGDICKLAIYDHMLEPDQIAQLADGLLPELSDTYQPDMTDEAVHHGWNLRNGFTTELPHIPDNASVRKVEIHDAYDLKRWWWKACDGIRETTWPGVYNRSALKGRNDYFQLPDWDCYSISGKSITFTAPEEDYNHIEISGSAFGTLELVDDYGTVVKELFERPSGLERTTDRIEPLRGGKLKFTNVEMEQPIGDFSLFHVTEGTAPVGKKQVCYQLASGYDCNDAAQAALADFIKGRYTPYERHIMTALPVVSAADESAAPHSSTFDLSDTEPGGYPFFNIIVPYEFDDAVGLDGIELTLTAPAGESDVPFSVQIKDPLWYYRNLAHFSFSAEAGSSKTIWFDLRDRCLPKDRCLYITIACGDAALDTGLLGQASLRLIYKSAEDAREEHTIDRFTQVRDVYGHLVEEQPGLPDFDMYNRFKGDIEDLLRVCPDHKLGQYYYYDKMVLCTKYENTIDFVPDYHTAPVPADVPAWAFKQVEYLRHYKYLINWWIDNRQIENGEFGGGLSDDGDYTAMWVGLAEMGCDPEKIIASLELCTNAFYEQGLFTNGLPSIQTDELHTAEEGLISLGQCLTADFANPKYLEHAMETARSLWWITGINSAGHRHIRSTYYNGSKMATEMPWGVQMSLSTLALTPAWYIGRFNGNPKILQLITELADGLAAHFHPETGEIHSYVRFDTDEEIPFHNKRLAGDKHLLYPAYKLTGNQHYYDIIPEHRGVIRNSYGQISKGTVREDNFGPVNKEEIAQAYEKLNFIAGVREYYNTEGHPWIDRVYFNPEPIQQDRLAGIAHCRNSIVYPRNGISWRFQKPGDDEKLAILSPVTRDDLIKLIVYNLDEKPVTAKILGREVLPGTWRITTGIDTTGDDSADSSLTSFETPFERSTSFQLAFAPKATTIVMMELIEHGTSYWERCDLGVGPEDVHFYAHGLNVTIHSLGAVDSPDVTVALKDKNGNILKTALLPSLPAPTDLWPRWREVSFNLHGIASLEGCYVEIDPEHRLQEITRANNIVYLPDCKS